MANGQSWQVSPGISGGASHDSEGEYDLFLPIANIGRIMKKVLPANGKIAKDAKETVQEYVSEFISFVTSEVNTKGSYKGADRSARKEVLHRSLFRVLFHKA